MHRRSIISKRKAKRTKKLCFSTQKHVFLHIEKAYLPPKPVIHFLTNNQFHYIAGKNKSKDLIIFNGFFINSARSKKEKRPASFSYAERFNLSNCQ